MTVPTSLLPILSYDALLVREGGTPRVVKEAGVTATSNPPEMAHLDPWMKFDFRGTMPASARRAMEQAPPVPDAGWKIHLSIDPDQVAAAWDAMLPEISKEPILVKVMTPPLHDQIADPDDRQAGKGIVVYAAGCPYGTSAAFWSRLLTSVEGVLRTAGVPPGWAVMGDRPIRGSNYAFARADKDPMGRYASEIEAFNPYGFGGPFDDVQVSSRERIVPFLSDSPTRVERLLGFVSPGWEAIEDGYCLLAADATDAAMTHKAMTHAGLKTTLDGEVVNLLEVSEGDVIRRWHAAMEIRRAAEVGGLIRDAVGTHVGLSLGARRDIASPPTIKLAFQDPTCAAGIRDALTKVFSQPAMHLEDTVLSIPYGGRLHVVAEDRRRYFDRVAAIVADAAARLGCCGPKP